MKMMKKKIRSLIYAGLGLILCVLLCGGIGMTAQAAKEKTYNGFTYEDQGYGIVITGYKGSKTELVIPEKIAGKKVVRIGCRAFENCIDLVSITIPEGVTTIDMYAFSYCKKLSSITLPENLTKIETCAFEGCKSLTGITLPESLTNIGIWAFASCDSLTNITIPKDIQRIGNNAFSSSGLKSVILEEGITKIDDQAFEGCKNLASITIPDSVTSIGYNNFTDSVGNISLGSIICNKGSFAYKYAKERNIPIKLIPGPAKKGTTLTVSSKKLKVKVTSSSRKNPPVTVTKFTDNKAKNLTIPSTVKANSVTYKVTAISDKAFKGNKKLTTVTIGSNVTKIGKEAFSGCKNLKKITVTAGKLKTIGKNAFKGINKKATITVKGTKKAKTALKKQLKKKSIGYVKTWKIK